MLGEQQNVEAKNTIIGTRLLVQILMQVTSTPCMLKYFAFYTLKCVY